MKKLSFMLFIYLFFSLSFASSISEQKKTKKLYPLGKKVYEKLCVKNINFSNYQNIDQLKLSLENNQICKPLKKKYIQAVLLYLWDVKRIKSQIKIQKIKVTKKEKCPVCGMFVYKYPKWISQIFYKTAQKEFHYSFDGVKDMMKFYFAPNEWGKYSLATKENIIKILVRDYYSQKIIDAKKAFYVVNSDIYGPMGRELIPFKNQNEAKTFKKDHKATSVIAFDDISLKLILLLD
jgi:nitrous oxide reductase accessory protein NosL